MIKFRGIIPALITPFNSDGSVFYDGLVNEINYLQVHGYRNVFVCGSYGAFPLMTTEQRKYIAEKIIPLCKDRNIKTIIQIGSPSTEIAIELTKHAESCGADAVSSVAPFYYSGSFYNDYDIIKYFKDLVDNCSIDVHCYNNPKTTGYNINEIILKHLIDVGVCGIKDGGSDMGKMIQMLSVIKESGQDFNYYPSSTSSMITGFLLGVDACISGVCLAAPDIVMNLYECMVENNINRAMELFKIVMKIRSALGRKTGRAIATYDVLNNLGVNVGTCKKPWKRLSHRDAAGLIYELEYYNELV